ncbi:nucleotide-binding domain-containing protein [Daedalea quercina L-15889]|uniref:Nucleotide-binding domain-containing protein n=1 Tax=Daedalea quercina L-15889 TaxID=1314783 RepID=A0A165PLV9_9APHY|nr:nucleotide-binding domain-containing protein [Daedalea quercina L-15889]
MSSTDSAKHVVVLGAGVVGLSTAIRLVEKGHSVSVIAEHLPTDPRSIEYTSPWAGAYHVMYMGDDARQKSIREETLKVMLELSAPGSAAEHCFRRLQSIEYFLGDVTPSNCESLLQPKRLPEESLHPRSKSGYIFSTYTIDTTRYLNYLLARLLGSGGAVVRGSVQHVSQVVEGAVSAFGLGRPADALVVCAGLGARTLGGVEDGDVHPVRGQRVLVHAPWVDKAIGLEESPEKDTYLIPRRNGNVILGGTRTVDDWFPVPRSETTEDILARCLALYLELAPPAVRAQRTPTVDDLRPLIVEVGCGLRPMRQGGIRSGVEWLADRRDGRRVPMVFNYGHGSSGYECSWGSADVAVSLLEGAIGEKAND